MWLKSSNTKVRGRLMLREMTATPALEGTELATTSADGGRVYWRQNGTTYWVQASGTV